eukprot:TRINITY_DN5361_c0_g1_i1.p2 TRINITY_DN5361_c0_g1~~TRINITY_DN5361_c0_g1_i1.p2  ORF type:complete len:468 (-),score=136.33 TRINITY_DN5361_c0_g1_i1:233-1636(-)
METQSIDSSFPDERPVHFIAMDSAGKFFIQEEALAMIRGIKKKVAVITVAGQYRTGKSYLLNRLLGRQSGFELGSTINPCTKGLWIWSKPININENLQAIFLDTEGLASLSRNVHVDTMIFALSLLASSYFIYNSMHALNEKALESLGLIVSLSKYIHVSVRPGNVSEDLEEYSHYFPYFMWVVRDFALKLVNTEQQTVTDRQYLENALRPVDPEGAADVDQVASKNEIRGKLTTFFKERDCITLVRPLSDEKALREIDKVPYENLRPEFRAKMELLIRKVYSNIRPKVIDGQPLTGEMFATLLEQYVAAFNGGTVPTIETAWDQVITLELDRVIEESIEQYKRKVAELSLDRLPMAEEEIKKVDEEAKREAYNKFYESELVNVGPERMSMARTKMEDAFVEIYKKLRSENFNVSYKDSEELFNKLYEKIREQMDTLKTLTYDVVASNWVKLKEVTICVSIVLSRKC